LGIVSIVFYTLGQLSTDCEIIKLPAYTPSDEERADTRLFADNVAKAMCDELGVLQSFYSYDDVMFMGFAYVIIKLSLMKFKSFIRFSFNSFVSVMRSKYFAVLFV
jgi:hypothetical protein